MTTGLTALLADEPLFFVVIAVRSGADHFSYEGIFSKEDDAAQLVSELEQCDRVASVVNPMRMTMREIKDRITDERLGALAKQFKKRMTETG